MDNLLWQLARTDVKVVRSMPNYDVHGVRFLSDIKTHLVNPHFAPNFPLKCLKYKLLHLTITVLIY